MEARLLRVAALAAAVVSLGATFRTPNFVVEAPTEEFAQELGQAAEKYRHELAIHWLGEPLPKNWSKPCPIRVQVGESMGAGGATSFLFDRGEVFGWKMNIQGSRQRIIDSVLPHEVTHTIFASYFRQPLPRWADEGACTTVEHKSERAKQQEMLIHFLKNSRGIAFSRMFMMKEYPDDVMPLYSQGYSLTTFLIQRGGRKKFLEYVQAGLENEQWMEVTEQHYGFPSLAALQDAWLDWVRQGSPAPDGYVAPPDAVAYLDSPASREGSGGGLIYRGQSVDPPSRGLVPVRPRVSAGSLAGGPAARRPRPEPEAGDAAPGEWGAAEGGFEQSESMPAESDGAESAYSVATDSRTRSRHVLLEWTRDEDPGVVLATEAGHAEKAGSPPRAQPVLDASQGDETQSVYVR
jgi:hypothetical protein